MINGITLLAESTVLVQVGTTWGFTGSAIIGILFFILGLTCIICMICYNENHIIAWILSIILIIMGILGWHTKPIMKEVPQYKVLIDDTVTFKNFNDKYTLISQEGEIFTIEEKMNTDINN